MQTRLVTAACCVVAAAASQAQQVQPALIPHADWDCYMPSGIPAPEDGEPVFTIEVPLERAVAVGQTQYGERSIAVGLSGTLSGPRLSANVFAGTLDFALELANGTVEIEQTMVLQTNGGSFIFVRNQGVGPDESDLRVVMDFEAPNDSELAWLNSGRFVARRQLDASGEMLRLSVFDVADVPATSTNAIVIAKPAGIPAQPWDYRSKTAGETEAAVLITENVTLAPGQMVGPSKRGNRNIIPITGGTVTGRISGQVLMGGADYQILTPPATIDAHYLWQTDDGEIIIVRNGGAFGSLVPTFETRVDGPYAYLNSGLYLSSNPGVGQDGVSLTFYESSTQ